MDPLQGIKVEYEDYEIETENCYNGNDNHLNIIVKEVNCINTEMLKKNY